jgi:hypothetical protein
MQETLAPGEEGSQDLVSRLDFDFSNCSEFLSLLFKQSQSLSELLFNTGDEQTAIRALSFLSSQILNKDLLALFNVLVDNITSPNNFTSSKICFEFENQLFLSSDQSTSIKIKRSKLNDSLAKLLEELSKKATSSFSLKLSSAPSVTFSHSNFAIAVLLNLISSLVTLIDELSKALHSSLTKNFESPPSSLLSMLGDLPSTRKAFLSQGKRVIQRMIKGVFETQVHTTIKSLLIPLRKTSDSNLQLNDFAFNAKCYLGIYLFYSFMFFFNL